MIAPEGDEVMVRMLKLIPKMLLTTPGLEPLQADLKSEKENDYYYSLMNSIGKSGLQWSGLWCGWHCLSSLSVSCVVAVIKGTWQNQFKGGLVYFVSWFQSSGDVFSCLYCF